MGFCSCLTRVGICQRVDWFDAYAKMVLLPFEVKIIYDSLIYTYNITYGSGIRKRFNEEYRELKKSVGVITTL